jgi:methyl-accepting chemotaxis protein
MEFSMQWLKNLSIKLKISLIPAVSIIGFLVFLLITINSGSKNIVRLNEISDKNFPVLALANSNIVLLDRINELTIGAASTGEQDMLDKAKNLAGKISDNLSNQQKLQPASNNEINTLQDQLDAFTKLSFKLTQDMIDGTMDFSNIADVAANKKSALDEITKSLVDFNDTSLNIFTDNVQKAIETEESNLLFGAIIGVVSLFLTILMSITILSLITSGVARIIDSLKDIAQGEGDLTVRIKQDSNDELGELVSWFNMFVEKLQGTIGDVVNVISPLNNASSELTQLSAQTSVLSTQQRNDSEFISQAMADMLNSVVEEREKASSAAEAATEADKEAKEGYRVVQNTVKSITDLASEVERAGEVINKLESDTESVAGILDVIKGIAEQTNLLALNAAIEAARAGEQGRGFAVVADEVRTLASRTQESTLEIQKVIEQLQTAARSAVSVMDQGKEQARSSVELVNTTGEKLELISGQVTSITQMNNEISEAIEDQHNFANSIRDKIEAMKSDAMTSEANTGDVSILSASLQKFADKLQTVGSQFKV